MNTNDSNSNDINLFFQKNSFEKSGKRVKTPNNKPGKTVDWRTFAAAPALQAAKETPRIALAPNLAVKKKISAHQEMQHWMIFHMKHLFVDLCNRYGEQSARTLDIRV